MAAFLVTGGTGFIGSTLVPQLVDAGHEAVVVTRTPEKHAGHFGQDVRFVSSFNDIEINTRFDAVVNLGGEGIGDKRWSDKRKQVLRSSRVGLTEHLVKFLARLQTPPEIMISGSAIGWYGAWDKRPLTENSGFHGEFTHDLCQEWENAASAVKDLGTRLCIIRLGVVLGRDGGVLKKLLPPFYFGLGGQIGSGEQIMSWVHLDDVVKAINTLANEPQLEGVFNLTAPEAVTNKEFTRELGAAISRPTLFPMPGIVVRTLFGEMGDRLLLQGQNVVPERLSDSGFTFTHPSLEGALNNIFKS